MTARILILSACLLAGAALMAGGHRTGAIPAREPLSALPVQIGPWSGQQAPDMSDRARSMLQVDDYVNRFYVSGGGSSIGLYVGYHVAGGIHSPLNCLPGSGWTPVSKSDLKIPVASAYPGGGQTSILVNRIVILKGLDKQVVLYWYQGCGRVTASEYWGLIYGMIDKARRGRTDAALIRIVSPAESLEPSAEDAASRNAVEFAGLLYPMLSRFIPD